MDSYNVNQPYPRLVGLLFDEDDESDQYCSYKITIQTTVGDIVIVGCHDDGPDIRSCDNGILIYDEEN